MPARPRILVHACCASCASYVLEHLAGRFDVTALFYNPNIQPESEYRLRLGEMPAVCRPLGIELIEGHREPGAWEALIAPVAHLPEGGERCRVCYRMRLDETARAAARLGIALIATTLSVSPHKVWPMIVEQGRAAAARAGVEFLEEDFKKRGGFGISCERSRELGLTRQDYCGCLPSLEEARRRRSSPHQKG
ncbi:MAG: epoxyqueuosine reductase QueH [Candidatus Krumholzibacteria bacterium]|nr:epoxyqueuosine reductase QueH [Candidatus Krumholzibacteria bacterium]